MSGFLTRVSEIIGRVRTVWKYTAVNRGVIDTHETDYSFWDKLRYGAATGFEMAGLFCKPILEIIVSYVWGSTGIQAQVISEKAPPLNLEYTNKLLSKFIARVKHRLREMLIDLYALGDQYVVVNADETLSIPPPDQVDIEFNALDYRDATKVTIKTKMPNGTLVEDAYTAIDRIVKFKYPSLEVAPNGRLEEEFEFENLIGRLPVVHFPNDRGSNEIKGRPIYEALYKWFARYEDLLNKALDGAELMGNPVPVFEGMEDIKETIAANSEPTDEEWDDDDGNGRTRKRLSLDRLAAFFLGKGGKFHFASPVRGFTEDIRNMLKLLFLLLMDFTRIPEVIWGGELSSARNTSGNQMQSFYMYIESRRSALEGQGADEDLGVEAQGGLLELLDIWLRTRALVDRNVVVGQIAITWPDISEGDEEIKMKHTQWAHMQRLITDRTALKLTGLVHESMIDQELDTITKLIEAEQQEQARQRDAMIDEEIRKAIAARNQEQTEIDDEVETEAA